MLAQVKRNFMIRLWALKNVPMLNWVKPNILELSNQKAVVKIPLNRRTSNHLGSMYFGVLACGADLAGGLIAFKLIQTAEHPVSLVFKDFKAEFLKRPEGDTHFTCSDGAKIVEQMRQTLETGDRVNKTVEVVATCPSKFGDEPVAHFQLTLSLKRRGKR